MKIDVRQLTYFGLLILKLETWQLQMHCNLKLPEPHKPFPALITTPCQVWSRWTYPLPYYSVSAADTLLYAVTRPLTLWPWPLTFDLEHLQHIACDMMKLCTRFERTRAIRGVIAISVFDHMTWTFRYVLRPALR